MSWTEYLWIALNYVYKWIAVAYCIFHVHVKIYYLHSNIHEKFITCYSVSKWTWELRNESKIHFRLILIVYRRQRTYQDCSNIVDLIFNDEISGFRYYLRIYEKLPLRRHYVNRLKIPMFIGTPCILNESTACIRLKSE